MLKHVVMFRFTDARRETLDDIRARMLAMRGQIPQLLSIEVGLNEIDSARAYPLVLISTHESIDGLRAYQAHPVHQAMLSVVAPLIEQAASVDFTVE